MGVNRLFLKFISLSVNVELTLKSTYTYNYTDIIHYFSKFCEKYLAFLEIFLYFSSVFSQK